MRRDRLYCTTRGQGSWPAVCPSMSQQSQQNCMSVAVNDFAAAAGAAGAIAAAAAGAAGAIAAAAAAAMHLTIQMTVSQA